MNFFAFDKNRLIGFCISLGTMIIIALIYSQTILFDSMERGVIDQFFNLRDPGERGKTIADGARQYALNPKAHKDIIIIGIDESTIRRFSEEGKNWPYSWDTYIRFTDYIASGNPQSIFYDIMFIDPRKAEEKHLEKKFADSLKRAGNVFLDFPFEVDAVDTQYADIEERYKIMNRLRFPIDPSDTSPTWVDEALPPLPILADAAKGIGFANVRPDPDHVNRKMPLFIKYKGYYYPNIDLLVVMDYYGITEKDVEIKIGSHIRLKNLPVEKMAKPNPERVIDIPIDHMGFMDINFIGGPGSFTNYSFHLFHRDDKMSPQNTSLNNKMILVAAYAVTGIARDVHKSPYGETFGIEHHASAINTIVKQDFLHSLSNQQNVVILIVLALFLGFLLPRVPIFFGVVITVLFVISYFVGTFVAFDTRNLITTVTTPVLQSLTTFTMILAYRLLIEQKEKRFIRSSFSKFVSKSVVDELLKHPEKLKLGGEKKVLTVLFSDIRGFTTLSESMTPEALVEHLNEYLQAMTELVFEHDGTLDKYVGDEIMAFWGAPIEMEDHALKACRSALEQMEVLEKMNADWKAQDKLPLEIGIGINTGDMVVGNMGSASRMDYTLMGDNVNLGARLEGTNKQYGTHVIISEFTYEHVKDNVVVRELDLVRVKGKAKPVKIYELLDIVE